MNVVVEVLGLVVGVIAAAASDAAARVLRGEFKRGNVA